MSELSAGCGRVRHKRLVGDTAQGYLSRVTYEPLTGLLTPEDRRQPLQLLEVNLRQLGEDAMARVGELKADDSVVVRVPDST